jgi:hypothetical protein
LYQAIYHFPRSSTGQGIQQQLQFAFVKPYPVADSAIVELDFIVLDRGH